MPDFIFRGTMHPAIGTPLKFTTSLVTRNRSLEVGLELREARILANVKCNGKWSSGDIRGAILEMTETTLGAYCLTSASAIHFCLSSIESGSGIILEEFDNRLAIEPMDPKNAISVHRLLIRLAQQDHGHLIRRCLASLRLAALHPIESVFMYRRAIESLVFHCGLSLGIRNDGKRWLRFREISGLTKAECDALSQDSGEVRHGGLKEMSSERSNEHFKTAIRCITKYFDWCDHRAS